MNTISIDANGWVLIIGAIFLGLSNLVPNLLQMYFSYHRGLKAEAAVKDNTEKTEANLEQITLLKEHTNSRMDQLLEKTEEAANLAGKAAGKVEGKAEAIAEAKAEGSPS